MGLAAYVQLVDWSGRQLRDDKCGAIPDHLAPIFELLGIDSEQWLTDLKTVEAKHRAPIAATDQFG